MSNPPQAWDLLQARSDLEGPACALFLLLLCGGLLLLFAASRAPLPPPPSQGSPLPLLARRLGLLRHRTTSCTAQPASNPASNPNIFASTHASNLASNRKAMIANSPTSDTSACGRWQGRASTARKTRKASARRLRACLNHKAKP